MSGGSLSSLEAVPCALLIAAAMPLAVAWAASALGAPPARPLLRRARLKASTLAAVSKRASAGEGDGSGREELEASLDERAAAALLKSAAA